MSIQSEITRISGARDEAFDAIEDKGVTVPQGSTIDDMADLISQISGGGGDVEITGISITTPPKKTIYATGDVFNPAGMTVVANVTAGSDTLACVIQNYSYPTGALAAGTTSVTITAVIDGETYTTSQAITVANISSTLNNNPWQIISDISKAGTGDTYWDIGDCKEVTLNGSIGVTRYNTALTLNNVTLCVFILGFNHPLQKAYPENNIIWGGFKTALSGGKDVALCDSSYGSSVSGNNVHFNMNHNVITNEENYGGWRGCDLRYDILGAVSIPPFPYFGPKNKNASGYDASEETISNPVPNTVLAAFPSELRRFIRLWKRNVDFVGGGSNVTETVSTFTVDAITLLAEYEIFGSRTNANQYEQNYQAQVQYYVNGNSKIKYKHSDTTTACIWWESSPYYGNARHFCRVTAAGGKSYLNGSYSYGIAPAFKT